MPANCLIISDRDSDRELGRFLEEEGGFQVHFHFHADQVRSFLLENPRTVVFWDGDHVGNFTQVNQVMMKNTLPERLFLITDQALNTYAHLKRCDTFGHHVYRRFQAPAPRILSKVAAAVFSRHPFGLERYLPEGAKIQKITLARAAHRKAAVEALKNFFVKQEATPRLSDLVAQAADELVMNALFDAPVGSDGSRARSGLARDSDFELAPRERVAIEVGGSEQYFAVSVSDHFGSLEKDVVLGFIRKNYRKDGFTGKEGEGGSGLGINAIIQKGLSLLFVSKPGVMTEVILFFPRTTDFKEFREGFRFLSLISE